MSYCSLVCSIRSLRPVSPSWLLLCRRRRVVSSALRRWESMEADDVVQCIIGLASLLVLDGGECAAFMLDGECHWI